jgi:nucleotide-binding universal stress UspA family protein
VIAQYQAPGTEVKVLSVVEPIMPILLQADIKEAWKLVQRTEDLLREAGYKTQTAVEEGDPKSRVIDEATEWNAELIVVGSHGRNGIGRFLMGSVAEGIARYAPCSVEIIRMPGTDEKS